jgi:ABC-type spermidine/putrescine transport system permease subunit II
MYMARALAWALLVLVCLFLFAPMLVVVPLSFSASEFLQFPPPSYTIRWYERFFADASWLNALWRSAKIAAGATFLATVTGSSAAYAFTTKQRFIRSIIEPLFIVPLIVPVIVFAVGAYLVGVTFGIIGSLWLIAVAHAVLAVPFVVLNVSAGLRVLGEDLELAAKSLGANPLAAFWFVTLPLIAPSIVGSAIMAAVLSFDEAVVALFLSSDISPTFAVRMYSSIKLELDPVLPVAATLVVGGTIALGSSILIGRALLERQRMGRTKLNVETAGAST